MRKISDSTVRRLSVYLRFLEQANTQGGSTKSDTANRCASNRKEDTHSTASKCDDTNGTAPNCDQTTREPSASEPARSNIAQREDAASVSAHLPSLQIRTNSNSPQWQAAQCV